MKNNSQRPLLPLLQGTACVVIILWGARLLSDLLGPLLLDLLLAYAVAPFPKRPMHRFKLSKARAAGLKDIRSNRFNDESEIDHAVPQTGRDRIAQVQDDAESRDDYFAGYGMQRAIMKTKLHDILVCALVCALAVMAPAANSKVEKKQKEIRTMAQSTLQRLYKAEPKAKAAVEGAAGYAVFSNMGVKILVAGSGNGKGIAVNNKTKHETFMKMIELQAGLGMGVKKFIVIFVFDNERVFNNFVNSGWQVGGQATAAAKTKNTGGAMSGAASVSDGVWMYQMTDKGLAAEITAKSTKYYKDSDLN